MGSAGPPGQVSGHKGSFWPCARNTFLEIWKAFCSMCSDTICTFPCFISDPGKIQPAVLFNTAGFCFVLFFGIGGIELEQFQPRGRVPVGPGEAHCPVERP